MSTLHDLIVIGAGIGGLTAAALAAHDGLDTLVLEAHDRPGGCAGDFALGGVLFPAGATLLSGFEPGGLHDWVYARLALPHRATPLDRAMEVVAPDRRFTIWTDRERWRDEVSGAFPADTAAHAGFFRWAETLGGVVHRIAGRLPVMPPTTVRDILRLAATLRPESLRALPFIPRTVAGVMHGHGADRDRAFARFVDAQLLDATGCEADTCAAVNGAIALDLYHRGCFALPGGPAEIARDLGRSVRRDGVAVRFKSPVVALRPGQDGVWRVRTAHGEQLRARAVVANVPAWDLPGLLGCDAPARLRRAVRLRDHAWGAFVLHAAVGPAVLPASPHAHFQVLPEPGDSLAEGGMCFITVLPPSGRPGAPRAVSVSTHTSARTWWRLNAVDYRERKELLTERLVAACERALPGFRAGLRFRQAATPRTFAHYTQRGRGLVGGVRQDRRHALFGALSHRSGLPGLYLCGDTVFPGQGTIGVTLSGINAWRSVRDDLHVKTFTNCARRRTLAVSSPAPSSEGRCGVESASARVA
jgi:C-3',4' desaturase CrtD